MNDRFYVYMMDEESYITEKKQVLIKVNDENTFEGFLSKAKAKEWIETQGNRQTDYIILKVFRHS